MYVPQIWWGKRQVLDLRWVLHSTGGSSLAHQPAQWPQRSVTGGPQHGYRVSLWGLWKPLELLVPLMGGTQASSESCCQQRGSNDCPGLQQCPGRLDFSRFCDLRQTWEKMALWNSVETCLQKTMKGPQINHCSGSLLWGWPHWLLVPGKQQDSFGFEDSEKFAHFHLLSSPQATRPVQLKDRFAKHSL